jgi:hypothetical protein
MHSPHWFQTFSLYPDPGFNINADLDPGSQIKAVPDPGFNIDADLDPGSQIKADPDPGFNIDADLDPGSERIRIQCLASLRTWIQ